MGLGDILKIQYSRLRDQIDAITRYDEDGVDLNNRNKMRRAILDSTILDFDVKFMFDQFIRKRDPALTGRYTKEILDLLRKERPNLQIK